MEKENLIRYIKNPENLDNESINFISKLTSKYRNLIILLLILPTGRFFMNLFILLIYGKADSLTDHPAKQEKLIRNIKIH
jgi:hypothetical protein